MKAMLIGFICLIFLSLNGGAADSSPFVRFPSPNSDGSRVAFCYQGDIWTVPITGGEAKRLTIHEGYDASPKWNYDGTKIAFSSNRFGNDDIFIIPSRGGVPKRMTYHSAADTLSQWSPNKHLLFTSSRLYRQVERIPGVYSVPVAGGTPHKTLSALGAMPAMSPDMRFIAFVRGSCRITREDYNGPANRDIWLFDTKNRTYLRLTDFPGNDFNPQWGDPQTLYYISSQSGRYNIHVLGISREGEVLKDEQITHFKEDGVRYLDISADGKTIVMERGTLIYRMTTSEKKPVPMDIEIGSDYRFDPVEYKTFTGSAGAFAVSPDGKLTAFVVRGEVFITENHKERSRTVNLSNHPFRDQAPVWLSDSALLFVSDRDGQEDLYLVKSADKNEPNLFKTLKHETSRVTSTEKSEGNPVVSPDKKKIAYTRGRGELVTADISPEGTLSNEKLLLNGWATPGGIRWSPDGRWLTYSLEDLDFNREIYIHAADNSRGPVDVSMHPRDDFSPHWSPDGSKLGFISNRNNGDNDIWFVWLKKDDWEKTKQDWKEAEEGKDKTTETDAKNKKDKKEKVKPVIVDFEDIHERLAQVTSLQGNEGQLAISKDGKTFYYSAGGPASKGRDLYRIEWDGTKPRAVTSGGQNPRAVRLDKKGKYLYLLKTGGKIARIRTPSTKKSSGENVGTGKMESLPFSAKMVIDHPKENLQVFNDAVRTLTDGFYDPNFHGRDWKKLVTKYRGLALKASTKRDFRDMFNIFLGQLNASHMGLYGRDRAETQRQRTALLGAEIEPLQKGVKVIRVVPDSPAHRRAGKLEKGDVILSVDGKPVGKSLNFYSLLTNKVNERVLLEVKNKTGRVREVVVRPTASLRRQLYDEWVKERRRMTDKYSNGRLGYLHIQAMGWPSFERFEREITACGFGKEGIVIDVRFNGGGWTTDYLMAVLTVRQHAYTVPRGAARDLEKEHTKFKNHYAFGERLPFAAWTKPSIAMCNENSYSNAEIFAHAYKTLGIGKLVGKPTFGAVISTGGKLLLDGSRVRLPFRGWFVKATEENMENGPAVPHIIVENLPGDKANGIDRQLKRAVEELLKDIGEK